MQETAIQTRAMAAARRIVSIFETGKKQGDSAAVAVLPDGAGISYGMHQATHRSGSLYAICQRYIQNGGEQREALSIFLPKLESRDAATIQQMAGSEELKKLLREIGQSATMRTAQEQVFDELYMIPAARACARKGWSLPLSLAVVYDSFIQGGFVAVMASYKAATTASEKDAVLGYIVARRKWLAGSKLPIVRKTVYRPDTFKQLASDGNWALDTPMKIQGQVIVEADLV